MVKLRQPRRKNPRPTGSGADPSEAGLQSAEVGTLITCKSCFTWKQPEGSLDGDAQVCEDRTDHGSRLGEGEQWKLSGIR